MDQEGTNSQESAKVQPSTSIDDPLNLNFDDGISPAPTETETAPVETPAEETAVEAAKVEDVGTAEQEPDKPEGETESAEADAAGDDEDEAGQASDEATSGEATSSEANPVIVTLDGGERTEHCVAFYGHSFALDFPWNRALGSAVVSGHAARRGTASGQREIAVGACLPSQILRAVMAVGESGRG